MTPAERTYATRDLGSLVASGRRFGTIYADPPWRYRNTRTGGAAERHYPTMAVEDIAALPVRELAAEQAHLHLWTTNAFLLEAHEVLKAWGFAYAGTFVWCKTQMGLGSCWRVSHEFLLLGVRGDCPFRDHGVRSWLEVPRRGHSEKPDEVRALVERVSPGPRLEMFARKVVPGWTVWGNEVPVTEEECMQKIEQTSVVEVASIRIGERHRKDLGDVDGLAASIRDVGLLHPVVVTPDRRLIAGRRRLEAVSRLGWAEVPARVVDLEDIVLGEDAENRHRKDLTPTEAVAIAQALEDREREKARQRQEASRAKPGAKVGADHGPSLEGGGKFPPPSANREAGKTRNKVAATVGMSGKTYEKARAVVRAAAEQPDLFGDLPEQMDETGKVDAAYRELRERTTPPSDGMAQEDTGEGAAAAPPEPSADPLPSAAPVRELLRDLGRAKKAVRALWRGDYRAHMDGKVLCLHLGKVIAGLERALPHASCPNCDDAAGRECPVCHGSRWVPRHVWEEFHHAEAGAERETP
jgi:N6-adenosine-specific RNA methylase IME4/ParB-like chromosome segregation protein Spo0J